MKNNIRGLQDATNELEYLLYRKAWSRVERPMLVSWKSCTMIGGEAL